MVVGIVVDNVVFAIVVGIVVVGIVVDIVVGIVVDKFVVGIVVGAKVVGGAFAALDKTFIAAFNSGNFP